MQISSVIHQPPMPLPPDLVGKKFGERAWAFIIDVIISFVINNIMSLILLIFMAVFYLFVSGQPSELNWNHSQWLSNLESIIELILYFAIFEWLYGRTPGKAILKMSVINYEGNRCSFQQAIIRSFYRIIDGFFFGLIAYRQMKYPLYQRLGDIKSSTLVINSNESIIIEPPKWQNLILATLLYMSVSLAVLIGYLVEIYLRNAF